MPREIWPLAVAAALVFCTRAQADDAAPLKLTLQPQEPSVYTLPTPPTREEGINAGGANMDIKVTYLSEYIFRGVNRADFIQSIAGTADTNHANFQFDGILKFNLDKLPHPF